MPVVAIIILGIIAFLALGAIIYIFFSPGTSKIQKLAALGALILSGLALAVCGIVLFVGSGAEEDPYAFPLAAEEVEPVKGPGYLQLIFFLIILIALFGFIIFIGIRERKGGTNKTGPGAKNKTFNQDDF
jgi:hypothetical protein